MVVWYLWYLVSQPYFGQVWGWSPTLGKSEELESSRTPECLELDSKAQNTSHWPFGHLSPKLWAKEGPGVKLPVWLPTTKSLESTSSRPPNKECDTSLERSRRGLQVWFRPRRDRTWQSGVMSSQSPGTPPGTVSGQFRDSNLGVPGKRAIWM